MTEAPLYPPVPAEVPPRFTSPSTAYRVRTLAVLAGLFAFLLLYLALVAAACYAAHWLVLHPPTIPSGRGAILVLVAYVGSIAALGMLLLFLAKGLFKAQRTDRQTYIPVTRQQQPELFAFIDKVCEETSAPKPAGVYVSPDVNAAVFYDTSLVNLVVPPRKYLLIGAGLVNAVGLREFKAVLAHEFGHFSQKSLAVGRYVYMANRILGDVVYGQDSWDDLLRQWCSVDIRFSFPAWGLRGVVWVLRKGLGGVFRGINLMHLSLGRQMEFNADDVAVSVAGSDAIVHTLCRVEYADRCFAVTARELSVAADHGLRTRNLFHHLALVADYLRVRNNDPTLGVPPQPPARVFDPGAAGDGPPAMWASHPPNHEREANAKRVPLPAPPDDRSAWLLFRDADAVRAALSEVFYAHILGKPGKGEPTDPAEVQAFIDAERAETTYDPKYHGLFDNRPLRVGDPAEPTAELADDRLAAFFAAYPPPDLAARMAAYDRRQGEEHILSGLKSGQLSLKGTTFSFRDQEVRMRNVPSLLEMVEQELAADREQFAAWDREMYAAHYWAAHRLDPARAADLRRRYEFQLRVQHWIGELAGWQGHVEATVGNASGRELGADDFAALLATLQEAVRILENCHAEAERLPCPALSNVADGTRLNELVVDPGWRPPVFREGSIDGEQIGALLSGYRVTLDKLRRVFFKGMGNILNSQERIAADFRAVAATGTIQT
jgi:Zn-dependent protease with chaperone function